VSLRDALATPDEKGRYVRRLFATIADRYDLITVLLSYGQDRRWKRRLIELAAPKSSERALDLACGTGDLTFAVRAAGSTAVGLDITPRMIVLARKKLTGEAPSFLVGDMMALPFPDGSFDLVTIGYGLRNVPGIESAIREIARVLRPGGRLVSLDFNRPPNAFIRSLYLGYLTIIGSLAGLVLHGDPDTYRYIPESIRRYPGAAGVVRIMSDLGLGDVGYLPVLGGLMAIHKAKKPERLSIS
jgi:ubiquinone/menaquinone biosynthesis methyltransferase